MRVINVDVEDTLDLNATLGAFLICELCQLIQYADDMEDSLNELLLELEEKIGKIFFTRAASTEDLGWLWLLLK